MLGAGGNPVRGGGTDVGPDAGARGGSAQLLNIHQAIEKDPRAWAAYFSDFLRRQLGAEELGSGGSAAGYARRNLEGGSLSISSMRATC